MRASGSQPRPPPQKAFAPNRILEVTPEFLDAVLDQVQEADLDVVSLDEAMRRLRARESRRFVSFTFDDGYWDNFEHAYPLFKRRSLPLSLFHGLSGRARRAVVLVLEAIVKRANEIKLCRNGELWQLSTATLAEKKRAFEEIYWWLCGLDEATQRSVVRVLADRYEIDIGARTRDLIMRWDEIRSLAADPLVTIGTHNKGHYAIAKLELEGSADRLEEELGVRLAHFSFPYGDVSSARARLRYRPRARLQDGSDDAQGRAVPDPPAVLHRVAEDLA